MSGADPLPAACPIGQRPIPYRQESRPLPRSRVRRAAAVVHQPRRDQCDVPSIVKYRRATVSPSAGRRTLSHCHTTLASAVSAIPPPAAT